MSVVGLAVSTAPQLIFDTLHTVSYEFKIFSNSHHFELHELGINHEHSIAKVLENKSNEDDGEGAVFETSLKLNFIAEPVADIKVTDPNVYRGLEEIPFSDIFTKVYKTGPFQPPRV